MPADPRRIGRLAGRRRGPLRRHGRAAAVVGRRGTLARRDRRGAGRRDRCGMRLRAFRRRSAQARRTPAPHRRRARRAARRRDVRRGRARLPRRRRRRPEDRVLSRPARRTGPPCARSRAGREVLNAFCYTGGFTLAALAGGATRVVSIDSSADALALARENLARNPALPADRAEWCEADVFAELRKLRDRARRIRPRRARSAEVRADRRARRARRARLQGHQSAGVEAAAARRTARDVFLLGRHRRRAVPQDRRRRGARCRRRRRGHRPFRRRAPIIRSRSRFRKANT